MALIIFRSRAASEIVMFARDADTLLRIVGKEPAVRGVIRADDIPAALQALESAVSEHPETDPPEGDTPDSPQSSHVGLRQRAFPLLQMLSAAGRRHVDVTWGI